ncbi:unnamed protein product [Auanema sp. JU1783]|nr:unnamed protein product [Auanema sp. JU1783]
MMGRLRFPMFSKLCSSHHENGDRYDILDKSWMVPAAMSFSRDDDEFHENKTFNLRNLIPELCTTCEYKDEVQPSECTIVGPPLGIATFKFLGGYNTLALEILSLREIKIFFECEDCSEIHRFTSGPCVVKNAYRIRFLSPMTISKYDVFPDELAYKGKPNDLMNNKTDWSLINDLYDMLDEDCKKLPTRKYNPDFVEEPLIPLEQANYQQKHAYYCVRHFTLSEHLDFFYDENVPSTESEYEDTFLHFLMKDAFVDTQVDALRNFFYDSI